jgi:solute carrier family 45 protein 1/2/4
MSQPLLRCSETKSSIYSAWLGWFPVLFYTSLYIGDLYRRSVSLDLSLSDAFIEAEANRLGSRALLYSAFVTLATNFVAPVLVSEKRAERGSSEGRGRKPWYRRKMHLATLWAISHAVFAACMFGTLSAFLSFIDPNRTLTAPAPA